MKLQFTLKRILAAMTLMAVSFALMALIAWVNQIDSLASGFLIFLLAFLISGIWGAAVGTISHGGQGAVIGVFIGVFVWFLVIAFFRSI